MTLAARWVTGLVSTVALAIPAAASAELVHLTSGRTVSVRGHRIEGGSIVLLLKQGGEIVCDASLVARITPDEIPDPEPPPPAGEGTASQVRFDDLISDLASEHGVDVSLVRAVIAVESAYRPDARSPKGAMGLMQLMPDTARRYAVADPFEPRANIDAGVRHLKSLLERYALPLALAAYNAGEAAVERFGGIPPFRETRDYVGRVMRLSHQGVQAR